MKTVVELATELEAQDKSYAKARADLDADHQHKRKLILDDMSTAIGEGFVAPTQGPLPNNNGHAATERGLATMERKPANGRKRGPRGDGPTTGKLILQCLRRSRAGLTLISLTDEMKKLMKDGAWHTGSEDIPGVISQNLNALKKKLLVRNDRDPQTNKNIWTTTEAA